MDKGQGRKGSRPLEEAAAHRALNCLYSTAQGDQLSSGGGKGLFGFEVTIKRSMVRDIVGTEAETMKKFY